MFNIFDTVFYFHFLRNFIAKSLKMKHIDTTDTHVHVIVSKWSKHILWTFAPLPPLSELDEKYAPSLILAQSPRYVKTKQSTKPEVLLSDADRVTATGNVYRKFGEIWTFGYWDMRAERQTDTQTCIHADRNTVSGTLGGGKAIVMEHDYRLSAVRKSWKSAKYTQLTTNHIFQLIAMESLGLINASGCAFMKNLGRRLSAQSIAMTERLAFCFSKSLFWFCVSMLFYSTTVSCRKKRRSNKDHLNLTFLFP